MTRRLTTDTEAKPTLFTPHSGHWYTFFPVLSRPPSSWLCKRELFFVLEICALFSSFSRKKRNSRVELIDFNHRWIAQPLNLFPGAVKTYKGSKQQIILLNDFSCLNKASVKMSVRSTPGCGTNCCICSRRLMMGFVIHTNFSWEKKSFRFKELWSFSHTLSQPALDYIIFRENVDANINFT